VHLDECLLSDVHGLVRVFAFPARAATSGVVALDQHAKGPLVASLRRLDQGPIVAASFGPSLIRTLRGWQITGFVCAGNVPERNDREAMGSPGILGTDMLVYLGMRL